MFQFKELIEPVALPRRPLLLRLATWPLRAVAARRAMAELGAMSDHELADVGLRRQDLRDATAIKLGDDPTEMLAVRAAERRRARWVAAVEKYGP